MGKKLKRVRIITTVLFLDSPLHTYSPYTTCNVHMQWTNTGLNTNAACTFWGWIMYFVTRSEKKKQQLKAFPLFQYWEIITSFKMVYDNDISTQESITKVV